MFPAFCVQKWPKYSVSSPMIAGVFWPMMFVATSPAWVVRFVAQIGTWIIAALAVT